MTAIEPDDRARSATEQRTSSRRPVVDQGLFYEANRTEPALESALIHAQAS